MRSKEGQETVAGLNVRRGVKNKVESERVKAEEKSVTDSRFLIPDSVTRK